MGYSVPMRALLAISAAVPSVLAVACGDPEAGVAPALSAAEIGW